MPPSLAIAFAEVSYWGLIGAFLPLTYVVFRNSRRNMHLFIPLMFGPASALCGVAACRFVSSQGHRMILAPLANLAAIHFYCDPSLFTNVIQYYK